MTVKTLKLTLVKSLSGRLQVHKDDVRGLGLRRLHHSVEVDATNPCIMGMVNKVNYLLKIEEV